MDFLKDNYETILIPIMGLYIILREFFSGSNKLKTTIISDQKLRIEQLTEQRNTCDKERQEVEKREAATHATLAEKELQIKEYKDEIAFRNPELLQIIKDTGTMLKQSFESNKKVMEFMEMNIKLMDKISQNMDYQTGMIETNAKRNEVIDDATERGIGETLKKPINGNGK